jgi:ABC-2 type transport system ATP-binding protein
MNIVKLSNVTKRFDKFLAVNDLSFEVRRGTIFGLIGPNGAGKSTTLRMIIGIFGPDAGEVQVLGEHVSPTLQQRIGYLPEERGLYNAMKVNEQLLFFVRLKGMTAALAQKSIDEWLERLDMSAWKEKKVGELSKGTQQKIQFIAAVAHKPDVLILDEPFSGLDPVSAGLLTRIVLDLKREGMTIIFSTHQMAQVEQLCDDICLLDHSKKVLGGSLSEVKRSFGRITVVLDYDGPEMLFDGGSLKKLTSHHLGRKELLLNEGVDAQDILKQALAAGARVKHFQLIEPSLNEIFIESVAGRNGKNVHHHHA